MTSITTSFESDLVVKEAYTTVKRRLFDASSFIEVTTEGHKELLNKMNIERVLPAEKIEKKKK